jgi:hypothetical protein
VTDEEEGAMGHSLSWLATRELAPESLREILGLIATGRPGDYLDHQLVGIHLANGWYAIVARGCNNRIVHRDVLARTSRHGEIIACSVEEHVMFSRGASWKDGTIVWSVEHRGDVGVFDLRTHGVVPRELAATQADTIRRQEAEGGAAAGVDYVIEVPLAVSRVLVGFTYDEDGDGGRPEVLQVRAGGLVATGAFRRLFAAILPWRRRSI